MGEDIVQLYMKIYKYLNYFLPIHCGSPDMANKTKPYIRPDPYIKLKGGYGNILLKKNSDIIYYSQNIKINNNLNSYLAGLFEGDGHI